jgi:hypothetical protein
MNFSLANMFSKNRFSKFFSRGREHEEIQTQQILKNSQGIDQEQLDRSAYFSNDYMDNPQNAITYLGTSFEQYLGNKVSRIMQYRTMSNYPIIMDSIENICDEAIVDNPTGDVFSLHITEELPEHIEEQIREEWDYLAHDVFQINELSWNFFKKFITDGEIYIELILDSNGKNVIGIKVLPSHTMMPIYENGEIVSYIQTKRGINNNTSNNIGEQEEQVTVFDKDQIVYVNYGPTGDNSLDVRGYLDSAIRVYNQLKNLEDSLVVFRLIRAPMRRIWNIFTGSMPKGKSEEYIKGLQQRYKKKIVYNSETGATDSTANIISLTEDYWFSKNSEGNGTTVETLDGASTFLQDLDDLKWIRENLYKALKIPTSRWSDPSTQTYNVGKNAEVTREEVKFTKFVERLQRRFKFLFLDAFVTQLRLKGFDKEYTTLRLYDIQFTKSNLFKEFRELEMNNSKLTTLASAKDLIYSEENQSGIFALEYAMKNFFLMTDEQWNENQKMLEKAKSQKPLEASKTTPKEETAPATPIPSEAPPIASEEVPEASEEPTQESEIAQSVENIPMESKIMKGVILQEWMKDISKPFPKIR